MDKVLASLYSFLSVWFNDFKKHVFKVEVTNSKNEDLRLLEKQISAVASNLSLVSKQLERSNSAQSNAYLKALSERIAGLIIQLKNTKEINTYRLEKAVTDLVSAVKRTEVTGSVSVNNFPKLQKIEGRVDVDFKNVVDSLQVLYEEIRDLKMSLPKEMGGVMSTYAGQTGSYKEKIKGTTLFDPSDATPTYVGTHDFSDAAVTEDKWTILKYTYSGSDVTKIVRKEGVWANRASLF